MTQPASATDVKDDQLVIVVLAYGGGGEVAELLGHLHPETVTVSGGLIVVHNPSRPNESLALSSRQQLRVVELATNCGYVGGMNAGIDLALQSSPEFVLLLTHDVRITADAVSRLKALMNEYRDLGAIGPVICGSDNEPYSAGFVRRNRVGLQLRDLPGDASRPISPCIALDGAAMMWRASALQDVRGFDERFFMYYDDIDICTRATRRGWRIAVATDVRATSVPGGSRRRSAHAYLRARNGLAYARTFGLTGLRAGLAECAVGLWNEAPKPGGQRFHDREARQFAATYWRGTVFGVLDYFRGRWGPPPPTVLRDTDIEAT